MSASGGSIRIMLDALGVQNVQEATRAIQQLRQAAGALQGSAGTPFESFVGPMTGLGQQRAEMESHLRTVTDMWKQVQGLNVDLGTYYQNVMNVGNAYGYQRDQMIAVRQELQAIQSIGTQNGAQANVLGFSRGYGLDPVRTAGAMGSFYQSGVLTDTGSQQQFSFMLADAVARGSQGGMNVMMDRFLPILQSLTERQLSMTPTGVNATGIAEVLTRFNQSGIPGFRNEGGMAAYQGLDQGIRGATQGFPAAVFYDAMAQGNPGYNYAQYVQDIAGGASDPESRKRILTSIYRMGPQGNDQNTQNYRALYAQQLLPNMDPATLKALFSTFFDENGNYIDDPALGGLSKKYGGTAQMDPTYLAMLSKVDQAKTPEQLAQVQKDFQTLTGRDLGAKTTGTFATDQQAIGQAIARQTQPAMGTQADQMDKSRADAAKAFEDAQHELSIFNQAIRDTNVALADFTLWLTQHGGGGPMMAANIGGQVGGAVLGAGMNAAMMYSVLRSIGVVGRTVAPAAPAALDALGGTIPPMVADATGFMVPAAAGVGARAVGGGMLGALGSLASIASIAGTIGFGSAAVSDRLGGNEGRTGLGLPLLGMINPGAALGMGAARRFVEQGPIGGTGLGQLYRNMDDWDVQHIPGFAGLFGRRTGGGGATASHDTGSVLTNSDVAEQRRQNDTMERLNQTLDLLTQALLNGTAIPKGGAYDQALQVSYAGGTRPGGGGTIAPGATTASSSNMAGPYGGQLPPNVGVTPAGGSVPGGPIAASGRFRDIIEQESQGSGFSPDIIQAIIAKEDPSGDPNAIHYNDGGPGVNSMGLMQVNSTFWPKGTPDAVMLDPRENIRMGIQVLSGKRATVNATWPGLSPAEMMHRTLAAYNGSINWDTGQATSPYATDVEGNAAAIQNGSSSALRQAPDDPTSFGGATAGAGGGGAGAFTFLGQVELVVIQNGQVTATPQLQFGVTSGGKFARIRNYPTPGAKT